MRAEEFDQKFDDGGDVTGDLNLAAIRRPALEQRRVPASPSSSSGSPSGLSVAATPPETAT